MEIRNSKSDDLQDILKLYEKARDLKWRDQEIPESADIIDYVALPSHLKKYRENMSTSYVRGDFPLINRDYNSEKCYYFSCIHATNLRNPEIQTTLYEYPGGRR